MTDERILRGAVPLLVEWDRASRRALPWRDEPSPYHVWISEIMLQQTRIDAVIAYYLRFLEAFPNVASLAAADDDRLMKLWEGLGYYSRARNLKKAACQLVEQNGGELPRGAAELRKLPGIGEYTAGAIASLAFGEPEPAVDGNVLRVVMRLLACADDVMEQRTRRRVTALLREIYPRGEAAARLTEGLMELGETLCVPNGEPACPLCPLRSLCRAAAEGAAKDYPVRSQPKARKIEQRTVLLPRCGERFAIRRRPESGLLAGLWEFPNAEGELSPEALCEELGLRPLRIQSCGRAKHVFTHVEWRMRGYLADCEQEAEGLVWRSPGEIEERYPIPTAFRYFKKQLSAPGEETKKTG